jgi:hypothetical protein
MESLLNTARNSMDRVLGEAVECGGLASMCELASVIQTHDRFVLDGSGTRHRFGTLLPSPTKSTSSPEKFDRLLRVLLPASTSSDLEPYIPRRIEHAVATISMICQRAAGFSEIPDPVDLSVGQRSQNVRMFRKFLYDPDDRSLTNSEKRSDSECGVERDVVATSSAIQMSVESTHADFRFSGVPDLTCARIDKHVDDVLANVFPHTLIMKGGQP